MSCHKTLPTLPVCGTFVSGICRSTVDSPDEGLVMWIFGIFLIARPNKLLGKQSSCWFDTPWNLCDVTVMMVIDILARLARRNPRCLITTFLSNVIHYSDVMMSTIATQITGVSNVCLTVSSSADQRKHQSSASLAFVGGIHKWPLDSPHKGPVTRKMFPFDDVIMFPQWISDCYAMQIVYDGILWDPDNVDIGGAWWNMTPILAPDHLHPSRSRWLGSILVTKNVSILVKLWRGQLTIHMWSKYDGIIIWTHYLH